MSAIDQTNNGLAEIWIVDDEPVVGISLASMLERNGYRARAVHSGEECLKQIQETPGREGTLPDLILMDINLGAGRMDGPEATRRIHRTHDIPVVLHSAHTDRETIGRTADMVKYGYVYKTAGNEHFVLATVEMALKMYQTEQALRERERRYRDLSNHLQRLQEELSARMAREIHDDLGQSLAALKMNLTLLERSDGCDHVAGHIADMKAILDRTVKKTRGMVQELRPPVLDALGIAEALEAHCEEFQDAFGVSVETQCTAANLKLSEEASLQIFRIVQEAMTNAVRHGAAGKIAVQLQENETSVLVSIVDNGTGFSAESIGRSSGFGFLSMRERAEQLGGTFAVNSSPGNGTLVQAQLPKDRCQCSE